MYYDYRCEKCDDIIEVEHSMKESPEIVCKKCKSIMKRVITGGTGVIYKGMGWVSKGTGTASKPVHTVEKGVAVPSCLGDTINKEATLGSHT